MLSTLEARRIAPLQLDFVNVLVPAHYLIPFSRLGPYSGPDLHSLIYEHGGFTEQWAHEAAVIPVETWPLLKHRMAEHTARLAGFESLFKKHKAYADLVLASFSGTWIGTFQRSVLEAHFGTGRLASANRMPNCARSYDLAEKRIPAAHDLADYYRLPIAESRMALRDLVGDGFVEAVSVEGWGEPAYLHPEAARPSTRRRSGSLAIMCCRFCRGNG